MTIVRTCIILIMLFLPLISFAEEIAAGQGYSNESIGSPEPRWLSRLRARYPQLEEQDRACRGPGKGEIIGYHDMSRESLTTAGMDYALEKKTDKDFVAHVVFKFIDFRTSDEDDADPKYVEKFKYRVIKCLDFINDHLKGPNGQTLQIEVHDPEDHLPESMKPAISVIAIQDGNNRPNSLEFTDDQNCQTTAHELLHHLGLVDEYRESKIQFGGRTAYDCRAVGAESSIMHDQNQAYGLTKKAITYQFLVCGCDDSAINCFQEMNKNWKAIHAAQACVPPMHLVRTVSMRHAVSDDWDDFKHGSRMWRMDLPPFDPKHEYPVSTGINVQDLAPPATDSLISETQFNAIVYPFCLSKNRAYYACAQNAYRNGNRGLRGHCDIEAKTECERNREKVWTSP